MLAAVARRAVCGAGAANLGIPGVGSCDRPPDAPAGRLCFGRGAGRGAAGRLDRLHRPVCHRTGTPRHPAVRRLLGRIQGLCQPRVPRLGRYALRGDRARGGCHAGRGRDGPSLAFPGDGREPRGAERHRGPRDREEPRLEPRHLAHRALLSRRGLLAGGLPQRPDRARRRPVGEQVLHGRHRDPEHQPLCHAGRHGRSGEHRQCRPDPRDQLLHRGLPGRPGRGVELRARLQAPRWQCRAADLQGDARRLGRRDQRQRPHRRQDDLPLFAQAVLSAAALQDAGAPVPAELHRRAGEGQDPLLGARRADLSGAGRHRQHEAQRR